MTPLEEVIQLAKELEEANGLMGMGLTDLRLRLEGMEEPTDPPDDPPTEPPPAKAGIWIGYDEIMALPMNGKAFDNLVEAASVEVAKVDFLNQDSKADTTVLAKAYAAVRLGSLSLARKVVDAIELLMQTDLTPSKVNILAVARNIPPYVIAADVIGLKNYDPEIDAIFCDWLDALRQTVFTAGNKFSIITGSEVRPNNIGSHCRASRVAIALYLGDTADLERAATVFKGWLGDREAYAGFKYAELLWQADKDNPVGINPPGAKLMIGGKLENVDGVLPDDQRRDDGKVLKYPFPKVNYAWEGLQGAVVTAEMLSRVPEYADVWEWSGWAISRALTWLCYDCDYPPEGDDEWMAWVVNKAYGTDAFPTAVGVSPGKGMGFTDWTHAN